MEYYLAIDIGATSGRHMLGYVHPSGAIELEEIHRFKNNLITQAGITSWDLPTLWQEIVIGLKKCKTLNKIPKTVGISTWAVDFVLLDNEEQVIAPTYAYRNNFKKGVEAVAQKYTQSDLFKMSGTQHQEFNTLFQLKTLAPEQLLQAKSFLMIPDYFAYKLTGVKTNELTNMRTTQLLKASDHTLNNDLLEQLAIPGEIFQEIRQPGDSIGRLTEELVREIGYDTELLAVGTHDTASAFYAAQNKDAIIISSGTWSLFGIVTDRIIQSQIAEQYNFTTEGGIVNEFYFLKNIIGMWTVEQLLQETGLTIQELIVQAMETPRNASIDINDVRLMHPGNVKATLDILCKEKNISTCTSNGAYASLIFHSLASYYKKVKQELEAITGKQYNTMNIIGGGARNQLLNQLIAEICEVSVISGPFEATARGNIQVQINKKNMEE